MTPIEFFQLIKRNWLLLLITPLVTACSIWIFLRKEAKEYASDTTIYTGISSTYSIDKNSSGGDYANSKAYSNLLSLINSRATKEEVALRLIARYLLLNKYDSTVLNPESYKRLNLLIDDETRKKLLGNSLAETTTNLTVYLNSNNNNVIYKILNSEVPSYSFNALNKIVASQVGNSDLVKIEYVTDDAAVCQQTLIDLTDVFITRHKQLEETQNGSVVGYFGNAATKARQRLDAVEKNLLTFQRTNNIIDYDDQSEKTTAQKEDLEQQANELELQYAGALSTLQALKRTLKTNSASNTTNEETYRLSNQLISIRTQIADAEVFNRDNTSSNSLANIRKLKSQAEQLEHQMQESLNKGDAPGQEVQTASTKGLVNDLIKNSLLVEELRAKLLVMRKQRDNFGRAYQKVVPLGAEKRKIERERELAEKEYLAVVNNLDASKVTQQNIELTSQLKVVDPPYLALNRTKSKRLLLLLFGTCGAMFVTLGGITAAGLLDQSLRSPTQVSVKTRLPLFGILPESNTKSVIEQTLLLKAEDQLTRQVLLKMQQSPNTPAPYVIGLASNYINEGKSAIAISMVIRLTTIGFKTLVLLPNDHGKQLNVNATAIIYDPLRGINPKTTLADFADVNLNQYEIIIIEFPALLESTYPNALLQHLNLLLVAARANRSWKNIDKNLLENISKATSAPIEIILTKVIADSAINYLGKINPIAQKELNKTVLSTNQWPLQSIKHSA